MNRIQYIDQLKGLTIVLVVMGHVAEKSMNITTTPFNDFYSSFHMPLFMFLSGIFAYKNFIEWNTSEVISFLVKKILRILLPFLTIGGAYSAIFCSKFSDVYLGVSAGFWFLPALFYCMLWGVIAYWVINKIEIYNNLYGCLSFNLIFLIIPMVLYQKGYFENIPYVLHAIKMYPFFLIGTFFSKFGKIKDKIIHSNNLFTIAIIGYVISLIFQKDIPIKLNYTGVFAIIILINLFVNWNKCIPQKLSFIGKHSLEIYVFHWFLLPTLSTWGNWLLSENANANQNFIILFCITLIISIPIILVSILFSKIIQSSRFFKILCFGNLN